MKKFPKYLMLSFLLSVIFTISACEKDDDTLNVSKVTTYATFEMTGNEAVAVIMGNAYSEPGIKALEGSTEIPVETSIIFSPFPAPGDQPEDVDYNTVSDVDTNTPGLYTVTYSATNSDEFPATTQRFVFVLPSAPDPTVNLSGNYESAGSPASVVSKVTDGIFYATNIWGQGSSVRISAYVVTTDGINLTVPQQDAQDRIYGYGTRNSNGDLVMKMSRPSFPPSAGGPLLDLDKTWVLQ